MTATIANKPHDAHQTMLAKLLAKENITVQFGNYRTAFFEPKSRVLGLPTWNSTNKQVSDLLVGHEVGHALYTPIDGIDRFHKRFPNMPFDILNIVEDIRIERIIQRAYPGLVYSFREGYRYFVAKDLFKIAGIDLKTLGFADRMNIHAKIGQLVKVPLSSKERALYDEAYAAETFDEVLDVCEHMFEMVKAEKAKDKQKEQPKAPAPAPKKNSDESDERTPGSSKTSTENDPSESPEDAENPADGSDSDDIESNDASDSDSSDSPESSKDESESDSSKDANDESESDSSSDSSSDSADDASDSDSDSPESAQPSDSDDSTTSAKANDSNESEFAPEYDSSDTNEFTSNSQRSFEDGLAGMQAEITKYIVNSPSAQDMMRAVTPISEVLKQRRSSSDYNRFMDDPSTMQAYKSFKDKTKKHIAVLIKEFERRKSAYQYSRAQRSTTGAIDVNRLHSYKYEDQIFKSVTRLADSKNHGLMFFIDYSGSMNSTLHLVIEQTIQLVTFCKAVGIPFEVYGFTSGYLFKEGGVESPGYNIRFDHVNVFEILNSAVGKNEYETAMRELFTIAYNRRRLGAVSASVLFHASTCEVLGATPLCETIMIAHELVKRFRAKHNVQRMNVMFLTDGDPCAMRITSNSIDKSYRKNTEVWHQGNSLKFGNSVIEWQTRLPKTAYHSLIRSLKKATGATVIGYFIADSQRSYKSISIDAIRNVTEETSDWTKAADTFKRRLASARRNGVLDIPGGYGHDMFFAFDSRDALNLDDSDEFESDLDVDDGFNSASSQNRLVKEFVKYTSEKKTSRVFLNKFSELIA